MSGTDELGRLLDRLKDEVGPLPAETPRVEREPAPRPARPEAARPEAVRLRAERASRQYRQEPARIPERQAAPSGDMAWRENKETMLFGMLASLTAALGGILAGMEYLVMAGTVLFSLFSLVALLAIFNYNRKFFRGEESGALEDRVNLLARKVESLAALRSAREPGERGAQSRDMELEHRVEELHSLFKNLARSVGRKD